MTLMSSDGTSQVHIHFPRRWMIGVVALIATALGGAGGGGMATWIQRGEPHATAASTTAADVETRLRLLEAGQENLLIALNEIKDDVKSLLRRQ